MAVLLQRVHVRRQPGDHPEYHCHIDRDDQGNQMKSTTDRRGQEQGLHDGGGDLVVVEQASPVVRAPGKLPTGSEACKCIERSQTSIENAGE